MASFQGAHFEKGIPILAAFKTLVLVTILVDNAQVVCCLY
jgi:hypothetical protein